MQLILRGDSKMVFQTGFTGQEDADQMIYLLRDGTLKRVLVDGDVEGISVVDNLTSTSTMAALSANQGRVLNNSTLYTNSEQSAITVGGISAGTTFNAKTISEMFDMLLYPELYPTIIDPSASFSINPSGLQEVGSSIDVVMTPILDRGSINPQYQSSSPYRSGDATGVVFTGSGISTPISQSTLNQYTKTGYSIIPGNNTWQAVISYSQGVQPKTNKGNNYDSPLQAGSFTLNQTITGVYAIYATTVAIDTFTKQGLVYNGSDIIVSMVAETGDGNKQIIKIPYVWGIPSIVQQYNTLSGNWDTIDFSSFEHATETISAITYNTYIYSGSTIGARQLKFKI